MRVKNRTDERSWHVVLCHIVIPVVTTMTIATVAGLLSGCGRSTERLELGERAGKLVVSCSYQDRRSATCVTNGLTFRCTKGPGPWRCLEVRGQP